MQQRDINRTSFPSGYTKQDKVAVELLKEYDIYDWYYSRALFETESNVSNDWAEVKDMLGQLGRITGSLMKKLVGIGKRKAVDLCVKAAKEYKKEKNADLVAATKYLFWTLLFFAVGYTGNALKDKYNDSPVVPGTHIEYTVEEDGTDVMTVTNSKGSGFQVKQIEPGDAPSITKIKAVENNDTKKSSEDEKVSGNSGNTNDVTPIHLLKPGQKHPEYYHGSEQIMRALAEVESFVDHIYDAKVGKKQIRKQDLMDMSKDLTIGYGHKLTKEERKAWSFNKRISKEEAYKLFKQDFKEQERLVNVELKKLHYYDYVQFSQGFIDAIMSITFNMGVGNLRGTKTRQQSEFWRRLNACRISKDKVDRSDVYYTISQIRHQNITERGHVARREAECQIMQQCSLTHVNPELYNLKG